METYKETLGQPVPEDEEMIQISLMKMRASQTLCLVLIQILVTLGICGFATFTRPGKIIFHDFYFLVLPLVIILGLAVNLYLLFRKKKDFSLVKSVLFLALITILVSAALAVGSTFTQPWLSLSLTASTFLISLFVMFTVFCSSFSINFYIGTFLTMSTILGLLLLAYFEFGFSPPQLLMAFVLLALYSIYLMIDIDQLYFRKVGTEDYKAMESFNYVVLNAAYIYIDYIYLLARLFLIALIAGKKKAGY